MEITIECQKRPEGSKPNALRRAGQVPAVLYGHNVKDSVALTIPQKAVETLLKRHVVNNALIQLQVPELSWSGQTLLREVQVHPWKGFPYHLSFFSVSAKESIEVEVALHFVGEPVGVKVEGGLFDPVMTTLAVKCQSNQIPDSIEVDITNLHLGQALHIGELKLPEGVQAVGTPNQVVVSILRSTAEEEAAPAA
jgi:large subunit ribosomal protein L25